MLASYPIKGSRGWWHRQFLAGPHSLRLEYGRKLYTLMERIDTKWVSREVLSTGDNTVAITTGVVAVAGELTGRAGVDVTAKCLSPTRFDRLHRLQLAWGQRAATARPVGRPVAAEDLAKCGHRMPAESVSSTPLANSSAFWVRCVESAVVVGERWPSQSWMTRRLTPASSKWVAQEWRKE